MWQLSSRDEFFKNFHGTGTKKKILFYHLNTKMLKCLQEKIFTRKKIARNKTKFDAKKK